MAVTIKEIGRRSGSLGNPTVVKRQYLVKGADDDIAAMVAMADWLDANSLSTLVVNSIPLFPQPLEYEYAGKTSDGLRAYRFNASWSSRSADQQPPTDTEPEPHEEDWDLGVESTRIYLPREAVTVVKRTGSFFAGPEIKLLGDKADGNPPEGVDWLSPVDQFSIPKVYSYAQVNSGLFDIVDALRGCLNSATFRGRYPAECCQYLGMTLRNRGDGYCTGQHKFIGRKPKTVDVDGFPTQSDVPGFEFVWPIPLRTDSENTLVHEPEFLCRGKVGYTGNFAALGVG